MAQPGEQPFWERPLETLDAAEWEALCDGCGKCCLHKVEDEDSGRIYPTNVACRLLDRDTARCGNYPRRRQFVPDCLTLDAQKARDLPWLPLSCAYRLRAEGQPLPSWHHLISGDREAVHRGGMSVRGWTVSEVIAGPLEQHIVDHPV